jgi:hypothetical protein
MSKPLDSSSDRRIHYFHGGLPPRATRRPPEQGTGRLPIITRRRVRGDGIDHAALVDILDRALAIAHDFRSLNGKEQRLHGTAPEDQNDGDSAAQDFNGGGCGKEDACACKVVCGRLITRRAIRSIHCLVPNPVAL